MPYKEDTHPGVLLFATQTIPTTHNYGISFNASPKLGCWEPQLNVNMAFLDMNANKIGITEHRNQPRFYISLDNNFNLPKGWFFNMEGYLSTASRQGFFVTRTEGQINARLSKSFLKETLTITFTANDILRTGPPRANIKEPEPDKAKRIVCNPSGEKEISVPLFTEDKETCRFYSGEETIKKSTSNDCSQKCTHASSALLPP